MSVKVVILCGGYGVRIRDVNENLPKPMLPIGQKPILWHIMKYFSSFGLNDFILCLGYKGLTIKEFFLNYKASYSDFTLNVNEPEKITFENEEIENWRITFAETGLDTMTGGRLFAVKKYLAGEDLFCLTYGDALSDVNILSLLDFHKKQNRVATLTGVKAEGRFGEIKFSNDVITTFNEKPVLTEGRINGGFMVFNNKGIWEYLNDSPSLILEREPFENLVADRQFNVFQHDGFWQCMDNSREYEKLNDLWRTGEAHWKRWK